MNCRSLESALVVVNAEIKQRLNKPVFSDWVEKLEIKCDGDGAAKILRPRDWTVDDFDATEIRRTSSTKSDGAEVYYITKDTY